MSPIASTRPRFATPDWGDCQRSIPTVCSSPVVVFSPTVLTASISSVAQLLTSIVS
jgi:hypothetical protein